MDLDFDIELDNGSDFDKPFLHIFAEKPICDPLAVHLKNNNFKAIIKGTDHYSFNDYGIIKDKISVLNEKKWNLDAGNISAESYQPELGLLIRSFFDKFIKNRDNDLMKLNSKIVQLSTSSI